MWDPEIVAMYADYIINIVVINALRGLVTIHYNSGSYKVVISQNSYCEART